VLTPDAGFEPACCERCFVLRMSDLLSRLFLPGIARALLCEAPLAALEIVHLSPAQTVQALETDGCDLALSMGLAHGGSIGARFGLARRQLDVRFRRSPARLNGNCGRTPAAVRRSRMTAFGSRRAGPPNQATTIPD
jgi:hypothetical protein